MSGLRRPEMAHQRLATTSRAILALSVYLIDTIPIFQPFRQVARMIVIVVGVLILVLLNFLGVVDGVPRPC
jgi:hypothetical protein